MTAELFATAVSGVLGDLLGVEVGNGVAAVAEVDDVRVSGADVDRLVRRRVRVQPVAHRLVDEVGRVGRVEALHARYVAGGDERQHQRCRSDRDDAPDSGGVVALSER